MAKVLSYIKQIPSYIGTFIKNIPSYTLTFIKNIPSYISTSYKFIVASVKKDYWLLLATLFIFILPIFIFGTQLSYYKGISAGYKLTLYGYILVLALYIIARGSAKEYIGGLDKLKYKREILKTLLTVTTLGVVYGIFYYLSTLFIVIEQCLKASIIFIIIGIVFRFLHIKRMRKLASKEA